ncbi:MAG: tryptophan 2,3-dioxygenase family protein [bacterium]|nr:tryptophan 2,3-dioxygenase family protein [bacterium]
MLYYADYLALDAVLGAQHPESDKHGAPAHDEMLFIITHQTFELWFKQVLFEVGSIIAKLNSEYVHESEIALCLSRLQRVNRIMEHLAAQFTIIETMSPGEFMDFRHFLNPASGFQSLQWRTLERTLGLKDQRRVMKSYTESLTDTHKRDLETATSGPTLFDVVERWLENLPFMQHGDFTFWEAYQVAVKNMFQRDRTDIRALAEVEHRDPAEALAQIDASERGFLALFDETTYSDLIEKGARRLSQRATLATLFIATYRSEPLLQTPYRFLDAIIELDKFVSLWRFRHVMMVSRMIGMRVGTGGSSGHDYLTATIKQRVFDDLTSLSSFLLPRIHAPQLPKEIVDRLQFVNEAR